MGGKRALGFCLITKDLSKGLWGVNLIQILNGFGGVFSQTYAVNIWAFRSSIKGYARLDRVCKGFAA